MPPRTQRPTQSEIPHLVVPREQLSRQLEERIERGRDLRERAIGSDDELKAIRDEYSSWDEYNTTLLSRSFSSDRIATRDYRPNIIRMGFAGLPLSERIERFHEDLDRGVRQLGSIRDQLQLYDAPDLSASTRATPVTDFGSTVFIVHGCADAARQASERFVMDVTGSKAVVLRDQPNSGRTIIEKFEDVASDIGFAVVLLTGDDEGGLRGSGAHSPRARQNVVFELGFFIAALGRSRVAVLYEHGVELPSDMSGVLYTEFDEKGAWRMDLAREMRSAGLSIDLNNVL